MIGAALGIDLGDRTIGLSVSDGLGLTAQGLRTLERHGGKRDLEALKAVCAEREITRIVVGLPRNMDGSEGPRAVKSRAFAAGLREALSLPVFLYDERAVDGRGRAAADLGRRLPQEARDRHRHAGGADHPAGLLDSGRPETDPA